MRLPRPSEGPVKLGLSLSDPELVTFPSGPSQSLSGWQTCKKPLARLRHWGCYYLHALILSPPTLCIHLFHSLNFQPAVVCQASALGHSVTVCSSTVVCTFIHGGSISLLSVLSFFLILTNFLLHSSLLLLLLSHFSHVQLYATP